MTEARTYMDGYSDGKEWAQADMLRTIKELQASLAWITEYIRAAPPELEEAKKWLLVMDNAAGASPVEPSESVEHRDGLAKRKPEPAAETVGGLAEAVKAARGGDAPPAPDCRTCEYMWIDDDLEKATSKESCARSGGAVCINGSLHKPAPAVVLWRTE